MSVVTLDSIDSDARNESRDYQLDQRALQIYDCFLEKRHPWYRCEPPMIQLGSSIAQGIAGPDLDHGKSNPSKCHQYRTVRSTHKEISNIMDDKIEIMIYRACLRTHKPLANCESPRLVS